MTNTTHGFKLPILACFKKQQILETKSEVPFLKDLEIGSTVVIPKVVRLEGIICRDGSVIKSYPPIVGKQYVCTDIIELDRLSGNSTSREIDICKISHEVNICDHGLKIALQLVFPVYQKYVYVLIGDNKYPIYVSNEGYVAYYLVDGWATTLSCCSQIR